MIFNDSVLEIVAASLVSVVTAGWLVADTRQRSVVTRGERAEVRRQQDTLRLEGEFVGQRRTSVEQRETRSSTNGGRTIVAREIGVMMLIISDRETGNEVLLCSSGLIRFYPNLFRICFVWIVKKRVKNFIYYVVFMD